MPLGNLTPGNAYYQASGEATPQAQMPQKFQSTPPPSSALNSGFRPPVILPNNRNEPLVSRVPRSKGMRYLYALGHREMPIKRIGADGMPIPWDSAYQSMNHGPIRNGGFNDQLFQAGYPGFNLGLSFKVPTLAAPAGQTGPDAIPTRGFMKTFGISQKLTRVRRATTGPTGA